MFNLLSTVPGAFDFAGIFDFTTYWYFYLAMFLLVVGAILFFIFVKPKRRDRLSKTQRIVYISVFTAISIVVNSFLTIQVLPGNALSFTILVGFMAGYLLGAKAGFIVGFVGDVIGCIIFPQGVYLPLMSISTGLFGMIPGILFGYFGGNKKIMCYVKVFISTLLIFIICSVVLNSVSYWILIQSKKTFWLYVVGRMPIMAANAGMNCVLCMLVVGILPRVLPKSKFVFTDKPLENKAVASEMVKTDEQPIDNKEENSESNTQS